MPAAHDLRRIARVFLIMIPHVNPDVGRQCLERAAQIFELLGPDPFAWLS